MIREEFGISQPAVSMHLRVLRESGFATVRVDGARRLYRLSPAPLQEVDTWLERYRRFWAPHLDALATELARGSGSGARARAVQARIAARRTISAHREEDERPMPKDGPREDGR